MKEVLYTTGYFIDDKKLIKADVALVNQGGQVTQMGFNLNGELSQKEQEHIARAVKSGKALVPIIYTAEPCKN